jgi:hypothetical protein
VSTSGPAGRRHYSSIVTNPTPCDRHLQRRCRRNCYAIPTSSDIDVTLRDPEAYLRRIAFGNHIRRNARPTSRGEFYVACIDQSRFIVTAQQNDRSERTNQKRPAAGTSIKNTRGSTHSRWYSDSSLISHNKPSYRRVGRQPSWACCVAVSVIPAIESTWFTNTLESASLYGV